MAYSAQRLNGILAHNAAVKRPAPINQKIGRLTILAEIESRMLPYGKRERMVMARCECGSEKPYQLKNIKSGNSFSCGCHRLEVFAKRNAASAVPQTWIIDGDVAYIILHDRRVLVNAADVPLVGQYRWYLNDRGYAESAQCESMHRLILGLQKGDKREADHKNHVPWDNRRSQIRIATSRQNKMNRRANKNGRCRYKGVTPDRGIYRAQIGSKFLGRFSVAEAAAQAYDTAARHRFGEFAFLNFPDKRGVEP